MPNFDIIDQLECQAYMCGDIAKADLLARIAELDAEVNKLKHELEDTYSLEDWSLENGLADEYRDFFYACFEHLKGGYPGPRVSSDYDRQVIFDAIRKGETHE